MSTPNNGINGTLGTGLVGHWGFDNGSLLDESGNNNTLINQSPTNYPPTVDKDGHENSAIKCLNDVPGSSLCVSSTMEVALALTPASLSFWVRINFSDAAGTFLSEDDLFGIEKKEIGNGKIILRVGTKDVSREFEFFTEGWHHIYVTKQKIYLDGVKYTHTAGLTPPYPNHQLWLFKGYSSAKFLGPVDEIRCYNRILTDDEVAELYEMGVNYSITKCETPVTNPVGGNYVEPQLVELSCATLVSTIYYTTNGVDPDENETLYTTPIEITENTILKAIAYAEGYDPSDILTEIYNIEGGNEKMEENQSSGLIALFWKPTGSTVETVLGEVSLDGQEVLSMQEVINFFNTKYAGNHPTEARVTAGTSTFTVDLIESPTLRALLSNTTVTSGTKTVIGINTGKRAITGQLRLHPMYNGADMSEDIFLLKVAPAITDERTFATENGRKLIKVVFTVMGVKTNLTTPAVTDFVTPTTGSVSYKMLNANDLGTSAASAAETGAATGDLTFVPGTGTNRAIFYKSTDAFATYAATSYYEVSEAEFTAKSFATGTVTWIALTSAEQLAAIPAAATGYYYKAIEIGV